MFRSDDAKAEKAAQRIWAGLFDHTSTEPAIACQPELDSVQKITRIIQEEFE